MFRILGSKKTLCDRFSRRDLLHVGGLGALGLSLESAFALESDRAGRSLPHFGRAKSCILFFLFGSPPQHETFDPKPEAPGEIRGTMGPISTVVPGLSICEELPRIARICDRLTVVRSMTHPYPLHGVAYALTGMPTYTPDIEARPRDARHWPFIGSIVEHQDERLGRQSFLAAPNIGLPWALGSKQTDYPPLAGPFAAFLGSGYDPIWTDFTGQGTRIVPKLTDIQTADVRDPFAGTAADGAFELSGARNNSMPAERFDVRRSLLEQFDSQRGWLERQAAAGSFGRNRAKAYSLLASPKVRNALDIQREPGPMRERYGMTLVGQSLLAARRLVEAGARFVSVFWDPYGPFGGSCWDTHANHFPRLKEYLLPVFDESFSALIADLDERGLLDETLVLCVSEHGRTPQIDNKPKGAGRHHWSRAYSAAFVGGGIARGRVVGATDAVGGDVARTPVSPKDVLATSFHLLGIDPETPIRDQLDRPVPIAGDGRVRPELLG